jgi:hypothetical protein
MGAHGRPRAASRVAVALLGVALAAVSAPSAFGASVPPGPLDDLAQGAAAPRASIPAGDIGTRAALPDGLGVQIDLAPQYAGSSLVGRVAGILSVLPHGDEMSKLTVELASPSQLQQVCGSASSCYVPDQETMVLPADPAAPLAMPFDMTVAHEYGHHIERNRSSADWNASNLGARHWATYEDVCQGVGTGQLFPGDEGSHYYDNPGEAFAQAYAFSQYPNWVPWWWNFARPDAGAYAAIASDVADSAPAGGPPTTWSGRLGPRSRLQSTTVTTPLDGRFTAQISASRAVKAQVALVGSDGSVLSQTGVSSGRGKHARGTATMSYDVCHQRSFGLVVRRRSGKGTFSVAVDRPQ